MKLELMNSGYLSHTDALGMDHQCIYLLVKYEPKCGLTSRMFLSVPTSAFLAHECLPSLLRTSFPFCLVGIYKHLGTHVFESCLGKLAINIAKPPSILLPLSLRPGILMWLSWSSVIKMLSWSVHPKAYWESLLWRSCVKDPHVRQGFSSSMDVGYSHSQLFPGLLHSGEWSLLIKITVMRRATRREIRVTFCWDLILDVAFVNFCHNYLKETPRVGGGAERLHNLMSTRR